MREFLEREPNLRIVQAEAAELVLDDGARRRVRGVPLRDGRSSRAARWSLPRALFSTGWRT